MKGGHGWARLMLSPPGAEEVRGGNVRVENSELNFVKSSSEMVPHVASDVIFEQGGGEAVTMNGGVGSGVVNKGHVCGFI